MQNLKHALAQLVASEARVAELVDPDKTLTENTRAVVKAAAAELEDQDKRIAELEHTIFSAAPDAGGPPNKAEALAVKVTPGPAADSD